MDTYLWITSNPWMKFLRVDTKGWRVRKFDEIYSMNRGLHPSYVLNT